MGCIIFHGQDTGGQGQVIRDSDSKTVPADIAVGVPQDSALGPMFFNLCLSDFKSILSYI